jgi:hypothetical protein
MGRHVVGETAVFLELIGSISGKLTCSPGDIAKLEEECLVPRQV